MTIKFIHSLQNQITLNKITFDFIEPDNIEQNHDNFISFKQKLQR